jgi:hypothetical protein
MIGYSQQPKEKPHGGDSTMCVCVCACVRAPPPPPIPNFLCSPTTCSTTTKGDACLRLARSHRACSPLPAPAPACVGCAPPALHPHQPWPEAGPAARPVSCLSSQMRSGPAENRDASVHSCDPRGRLSSRVRASKEGREGRGGGARGTGSVCVCSGEGGGEAGSEGGWGKRVEKEGGGEGGRDGGSQVNGVPASG